jgi:hypothetical protein
MQTTTGGPGDGSGCPADARASEGRVDTEALYRLGMLTTHADVINPDLLAFIQE